MTVLFYQQGILATAGTFATRREAQGYIRSWLALGAGHEVQTI